MQFERDLVGVTASVQQILVAPEYGGGMAVVVIGAAAGGVVAVLVLFRSLFRKRRKVHATRPSQEQELGSVVVNAQVVSGTAANVPMGMPVQQEQQGWFSDAVNAIESATGKQAAAAARRQHAPLTTHHSPLPSLPTGTVGGGVHAAASMGMPVHAAASSSSSQPTLAEMVEKLKRHCGVDGDNFSDVVHKAAHQLGIDPAGKSLMELAMMCMQQLGLA